MTPLFPAFRVFDDNGVISSRLVHVSLDDLSAGDVLIETAYSSVNYKDALAGTGKGKIMRRFPLIAGIDSAGTVVSSADERFRAGDSVLVTGYDLGVNHDGGFASYVRVPGAWVVPMPRGLDAFAAMTLGTAGFTAGLAVLEMERNGLTPSQSPVIVTGATGGVGSVAIACLSAQGYKVTAVTGKPDAEEYLRGLGASDILVRGTFQMGTKPLEKATWAGAVDAVGGETLAWLTRTMSYRAPIGATGLAGGSDLHTTVLPFILRGVRLLGIDSVQCPMDVRVEVWQRLASLMTSQRIAAIARVIDFDGLPAAFDTLLAGSARGRFVLRTGIYTGETMNFRP